MLSIFINQFKDFLIWILIGAAIVSLVVGEYGDSAVIGIILVLNAVFGFVQEYKAEKAIEALKKMASLKAVVIRDGVKQHIDASLLVPGDIILLDTGDKVAADSRLINVNNLATQEASLTGESVVPILWKNDSPGSPSSPLSWCSFAYQGHPSHGRGLEPSFS